MPTENATRRELRLLRAYTLVSTILLGALTLTAFRRASEKTRFQEIDVERINVVEKNGTVRMVISNTARSPGQVMHGKRFLPDGQRLPPAARGRLARRIADRVS